MSQDNYLENEVNKTLDSFEGIQRAEANPYVFTRIQQRLKGKSANAWERYFGILTRPVVAFSTFVLVILINVFVYFDQKKEESDLQEEEQLFASDYNLSASTIYDATIEQQ